MTSIVALALLLFFHVITFFQIDGPTLRTLCMQHGPLVSFHPYLNQGIALCKYTTREEANKAQMALNNCVLANTTIFAESPSENEVQSIMQHLPQTPSSTSSSGTSGGNVGGVGTSANNANSGSAACLSGNNSGNGNGSASGAGSGNNGNSSCNNSAAGGQQQQQHDYHCSKFESCWF